MQLAYVVTESLYADILGVGASDQTPISENLIVFSCHATRTDACFGMLEKPAII